MNDDRTSADRTNPDPASADCAGGESPADLETLLARASELALDVELKTVRAWKDAAPGRKAVGFMPVYCPRELIDAAGILPVALFGGGDQVEIIRGDACFQSYICHIPRSTVELALSGRLDVLDGVLFPSTCDVIRNLSGMWRILLPGRYTRYLDVPQNYDAAIGGRFFASELRALVADLALVAGRPVADDAIRTSIARYNENRRLLGQLAELRRAHPHLAPASEAYLVVRAGGVLSALEHNRMLRNYLELAASADRPPLDNCRVVLRGAFCEQPPLPLLKTLERAGCDIVDDDLQLAAGWIRGPVSEEGDPVEALASAFLDKSVATACRYIGDETKGAALVEAVRETRAEGVIFASASFCDPALLDQPMLTAALERSGISYTAFKYSEDTGQFAPIREQAGTFADSIKLWSEA
jgi:benzoyl-CoA reductase subunit C